MATSKDNGAPVYHEEGPVFYQKDGFEPRVAVTPADKYRLEADGWVQDDRARGASGATAKRAKRNTSSPAARKSTGPTKTTAPGVEVITE